MSFSQLFKQPLDRVAVSLIGILSVLILLLFWTGDRTAPQVREFSWQNQQIQADDVSFVITFNRPMNRDSVEANLKFTPNLPGKISWAGRRMAYTLTAPAVYGKSYILKVENAYDRFANEANNHNTIVPFTGKFSTPEPAFVYLGVEGEENGRLILYSITQKQKSILTPPNLTVVDFRIYSDRSKVLIAAVPVNSQTVNQPPNPLEQKLYTVSIPNKNEKPELKLILDSGEFQNFKFDLSADGKNIVVQRLSRLMPGSYGLWLIQNGSEPKPLDNQPGGDFTITPDSNSVAIAQGEGVAILPLQPQAQPLDFLPKFGTVLSFTKDGTQAAMIKFNKDYTRSLYRVTNQGVQQELLKTTGSILSAVFDPQKQTLYCLLTDLQESKGLYQEQPYLAAINLQTAQLKRLLDLPGQRNLQISLAPDGSALIFDQADTDKNSQSSPNTNTKANAIKSEPELSQERPSSNADGDNARLSRQNSDSLEPPSLKLLPLTVTQTVNQSNVESLDLLGRHPQWLP